MLFFSGILISFFSDTYMFLVRQALCLSWAVNSTVLILYDTLDIFAKNVHVTKGYYALCFVFAFKDAMTKKTELKFNLILQIHICYYVQMNK